MPITKIQRSTFLEGEAFVARFWSKVDKNGPNGCWLWTSVRSRHGYGTWLRTFRGEKRTFTHLAHRLAYELTHGEFDKKLCVCHRCDNPPCVNPAHLFLGTQTENMRDAARKGRCNPGPTKLTEEHVKSILAQYAQGGISQRELAEAFGVTQQYVCKLLNGQRRKFITLG